MHYVIGIDGGGTKTDIALCDHSGALLATAQAGPANLNSNPLEAVRENLVRLVAGTLARLELTLDDCHGICMGAAGAARPANRSALQNILRSLPFTRTILVTDDAVPALFAATAKTHGIVLLAGTGSICVALLPNAQRVRVGGWGHIMGDEGSAYDIACQILRTVMQSFDGREPPTLLTSLVLSRLGLKDHDALVDYVYHQLSGKAGIAAIAEVLTAACDQADPAALRIAHRTAAEHLALLKAAIDKLGPHADNLDIVLAGGVITGNHHIRGHLQRLIADAFPRLRILPLKEPAAIGAARLMLHHLVAENPHDAAHGASP